MKTNQLRLPAAAMALSLVTLDSTAIPIVQARIGHDLHASPGTMLWALVANCLAWAALLPTSCALRGRFGDRRVFSAGQILLAAASAVAAATPDGGWLVVGRAGQGAAAALIVPTAIAQFGEWFSPGLRRALPTFAGGGGEISAVLGSLACAVVAQSLGWRWIFWLNVPVCLVSFGLALRQPWADLTPRRALDPWGTLVFALGSVSLVWAVTDGGHHGWLRVTVLINLAVGAVLLIIHAAGKMPLGFARARELTGFRAGYACGCAALFAGTMILGTRFSQTGGNALGTWLWLAPFNIGLLACVPLSSALSRRVDPGRLVAVALGTGATGLALLATGLAVGAPYPVLLVPFVLSGGGIVLSLPTARRLAQGPRVLAAGQGPAASGTLRLFAGAVGIAIASAAAGGRAFAPAGEAGADGSIAALLAASAVCVAGSMAAFIAAPRREIGGDPRPPLPGPRRPFGPASA